MARRVHQVQLIGLAVLRDIIQAHRLRLDRDPALLLNVHIIKDLGDISRSERPPVRWISRSASVDLPWSIWAMIEKLRMWLSSVIARR
jgi:hypothetical protein